jgi:hypothetical protein
MAEMRRLAGAPTGTPPETARPACNRSLPFVEKLVENRRICLEFSGFLRTFAVRKKGGVPEYRR